jgi:hypothetical protein
VSTGPSDTSEGGIRATAGDVSSSDSTFDLFFSLTVYDAPVVTAEGC